MGSNDKSFALLSSYPLLTQCVLDLTPWRWLRLKRQRFESASLLRRPTTRPLLAPRWKATTNLQSIKLCDPSSAAGCSLSFSFLAFRFVSASTPSDPVWVDSRICVVRFFPFSNLNYYCYHFILFHFFEILLVKIFFTDAINKKEKEKSRNENEKEKTKKAGAIRFFIRVSWIKSKTYSPSSFKPIRFLFPQYQWRRSSIKFYLYRFDEFHRLCIRRDVFLFLRKSKKRDKNSSDIMANGVLLTFFGADLAFLLGGVLLLVGGLVMEMVLKGTLTVDNVDKVLLLQMFPIKGGSPKDIKIHSKEKHGEVKLGPGFCWDSTGAIVNAIFVFITFVMSLLGIMLPGNRFWLKCHGYFVWFCAIFTMILGLDLWFQTLQTRANLDTLWGKQTAQTQSLLQQKVCNGSLLLEIGLHSTELGWHLI